MAKDASCSATGATPMSGTCRADKSSAVTPWQAAIRETREETGLEASVRRLTFVDYRPERDELVFTFACEGTGGALTLNEEVDQLAWFAPSELPANIAPRHAERIIPVLVTSGPPMLRVQPGPGIRESLLAHDDSRSRFNNREFRLGAFATVLNERGSVLLDLRWDADFWGQPGGVEPNETPWDAVVREIHEETEIMAYVERLAGIYCWPEQDELIFSLLVGRSVRQPASRCKPATRRALYASSPQTPCRRTCCKSIASACWMPSNCPPIRRRCSSSPKRFPHQTEIQQVAYTALA